MKVKAGLWIDHKKCVVVLITDDKTEKIIINSNAEKHLDHIDDKTSPTSLESPEVKADDKQEKHFISHLNIYFDEIVSYINDAEFILIFGPGDAKVEFVQHINKNRINGQIEMMEASDKMTDSEIVAKAKEHLFKFEKK